MKKRIIYLLLIDIILILSIIVVKQYAREKELKKINSVLYTDWVQINANKDEIYQLYEDTLNKCEWANYDETDVNKDGVTDKNDLLIIQNYINESEDK